MQHLQELWSLSLSLFLVLAAAIALFSSDIVNWVLGARYSAAAGLIPWIVVIAVLKVPFTFMLHLARAENRPADVTAGTLLAVAVFVAANLLLIPAWGPVGAAWAGIVGYGSACGFWFSRRWNRFHIERGIAACAAIAAAAVLVGTVMGGSVLTRLFGVLVVALLVYQSIEYWRFLGRIHPTPAAV